MLRYCCLVFLCYSSSCSFSFPLVLMQILGCCCYCCFVFSTLLLFVEFLSPSIFFFRFRREVNAVSRRLLRAVGYRRRVARTRPLILVLQYAMCMRSLYLLFFSLPCLYLVCFLESSGGSAVFWLLEERCTFGRFFFGMADF